MELSTDIYKISEFTNQLQKKYMEDINEDTLMMSMYGYLNENMSMQQQNAIIMAIENGNEAIPIRAKFARTILANAVSYNIKGINAIPARMNVLLGFREVDLLMNMKKNILTIDQDCSIMIGKYEFHLDYDIIITKEQNNNEYMYTARYDIQRKNQLSDIENPYMEPPAIATIEGNKFILLNCIIRQIEIKREYKKVITNNILENKTFEFEFENQLADFDILVKEGNKETYLTPIFDGLPISNEKYCFYSYLDNNTIRVKFDRNSYEPKLNCDIEVVVRTTQGASGIFNYKEEIITNLESENSMYNNMNVLIKPLSPSFNGVDRKSIKDLKQIIPKERLSRGSINNNKDLDNFFNMIDTDNRLKFHRRRDNQNERLYYSYLLAKDKNNNVIPTNTIDIIIHEKDFDAFSDDRYFLNPGKIINYENNTGTYGNSYNRKDEEKKFIYSSPFITVINKAHLSSSYYLNIVNDIYNFKFSYINQNSFLQFIATYLNCRKIYLEDDKYKLSMTISQNILVGKDIVELDSEGNIKSCKLKPVLVLNNTNGYKYYLYGKVVSYNPSLFTYEVEFEIESDNIINQNNQIKLNNVFIGGTTTTSDIYVNDKIDISILLYVKFDEELGRGDADIIVPGMEGYTLCNKYDTAKEVNLFYNYSNTINSSIKLIGKDENGYIFKMKGVPVVRFSYLQDINRCLNIIEYVQFRKAYIDNALPIVENSFSVDLKFYNTYGPSRLFKIGHNNEPLDRVNLSLKFIIKLKIGVDKSIKNKIINTMKSYVENINNISNVHMTNLTTEIKNIYSSDLEFIEFISINEYSTAYQYIWKEDNVILDQVPEFVNINLIDDTTPDIVIM